ncbi:MAG: TerC family protein [Planctomycetota bacterium]|nr:TerC family protein [Planctomycetaceae bacterium]MDQ3330909.1 TerC family protein [Planctomycetota bacterium]
MDWTQLFDWVNSPAAWVALFTLVVMEIVLGIDNIIFISILASKLPAAQQNKARTLGLAAAMITRILLLLSISWIMKLEDPLFTIDLPGLKLSEEVQEISGRDIILLLGGLFLIGKATFEIHNKLEGEEGGRTNVKTASFASVIVQIMILDLVFSLDSVITAVGMADDIGVMILAVVVAVGVMMVSARPVAEFVERRPTVKMLALSFLILIGVALVADGLGRHIPKGYIYFAMAFSVMVELLNLKLRKGSAHPVKFKEELTPNDNG